MATKLLTSSRVREGRRDVQVLTRSTGATTGTGDTGTNTGGTFTLSPGVNITAPAADSIVPGPSLTVSGTAFCEKHTFSSGAGDSEQITDAVDSIDKIQVKLGTSDYALATVTGTVTLSTGRKQRTWTHTFSSIPNSAVVNDSLKITARITAGSAVETVVRNVKCDRTPPTVTITEPPENHIEPWDSAANEANVFVRGTATDSLTGVDRVEWKLDNGTFALATADVANWSAWRAAVKITASGPHTITVRARDKAATPNTSPGVVLHVDVPLVFAPQDPADVFGLAVYLDDLLNFASQRAKTGPSGTAITRPTLAGTFRQSFDELTRPAKREIAHQAVSQVRVAIGVLRKYFSNPPTAAVNDYCQAAYAAMLRQLGTSFDELRLAKVAAEQTRMALANRLGISPHRPDLLDELTLTGAANVAAEAVSETNLESLFGLLKTTRDPLTDGLPPQAKLLGWQREHLRTRWREQDEPRLADPLASPIIDPDLVAADDLRDRTAGNAAFDLWTQRTAFVNDERARIGGLRQSGANALTNFNTLVNDTLGPPDQLVNLAGDYDRGEDIRTELQAFPLSLPAFVFLLRVRQLAVAGTVLDSEWQQVVSVLVQVRKQRQFSTWKQQEANLTLGPDFFRLPAADAAPFTPPLWRGTRRARQAWLDTLAARVRQEQDVVNRLNAAIEAVEAATLPAFRDALLAAIGATKSPVLTGSQVADRLGQELLIDFRSGGGLKTTRLEQAVETLQGVLFSLRTGQFKTLTPLIGNNPAGVWELQLTSGYTKDHFDQEWQWMGSWSTWKAAMNVFIYPENHLQPALRPQTTNAFGQFVRDVRSESRLTPARARELAAAYHAALAAELGTALPTSLKPSDFKLIEHLTDAQLTQRRTLSQSFFQNATNPPDPHKPGPEIKELFYFVPLLLGTQLQAAGQYLTALDWFRTVYAYHRPVADRKIYYGLILEEQLTAQYQRTIDWLIDGLNPHDIAAVPPRALALTRFAILSLVRCFLDFADREFTRETAESIARARDLYNSALGLLGGPHMQLPAGSPFPPNPVEQSLRTHAEVNLAKLSRGLNIAGLERRCEPRAEYNGQAVVTRRPTPYRYSVLIDRAKQLVANAQQIEAAFLAALEQRDAEAYHLLQAKQDVQLARATVRLQDLRLDVASHDVNLAQLQQQRAQIQADHFQDLLDSPINELELLSSTVQGFVSAASVAAASGGLALISAGATMAGSFASAMQQEMDWQTQLAVSQQDVQIAAEQLRQAQDQMQVVGQERFIATLQADHAEATVDFLANKFTNVELFDWMSGVLERVYSYFLQQSTAVAKLAELQLAFERQETPPAFIQADYWEATETGPLASVAQPDRRGLTGSVRLLQDLTRLDEYAFASDRRKLQLSKTLSLAHLAPVEFARFRDTGVMVFATPMDLFDRDFPGHYLRLVKRVRTSVIALIPPTQGIRATLSNVGSSRVVTAGDRFTSVVVNHGPQSVALSSPQKASGLFELDLQPEMLLPFEGIGVDTVWELRLPRPANLFDYRTIADVLVTVEYTALDSPQYREQVTRQLGTQLFLDRPFSFRNQFADAWYDLHNPDQTSTPMTVRFQTRREDFPPNLDELTIQEVLLSFVSRNSNGANGSLTATLRFAPTGTTTALGGAATSTDGLFSTRRGNADAWEPLRGKPVAGQWELALPNTSEMRERFQNDDIDDFLLAISYSGQTPPWPT